MKFKLAELEYESAAPKNNKLDWCRWDERFGGEVIELPYADKKQMPTFFIYLVDEDGVEVCYYRDSLCGPNQQNFADPNGPVLWKNFEPDLSHGVVKDEKKAGYFSFRLYFHDIEK